VVAHSLPSVMPPTIRAWSTPPIIGNADAPLGRSEAAPHSHHGLGYRTARQAWLRRGRGHLKHLLAVLKRPQLLARRGESNEELIGVMYAPEQDAVVIWQWGI